MPTTTVPAPMEAAFGASFGASVAAGCGAAVVPPTGCTCPVRGSLPSGVAGALLFSGVPGRGTVGAFVLTGTVGFGPWSMPGGG